MTRCRIGDLAVVVQSIHPENIGVWVHVLRTGRMPGEWIVKILSPAKGVSGLTGLVERRPAGDLGYVDDANLQPIRGTRPPVEQPRELESVL